MEEDPAERPAIDRRRTMVVSFPGTAQTTGAEVGGKGFSLIRMAEAGLPVPPGAVFTTHFFELWFDEIKKSANWKALAGAPREQWAPLCTELKNLCPSLTLTQSQERAMENVHQTVATSFNNCLLAVRSSSPEEDLVSASFAGGYETRLGVRPSELDEAIRHCFASSLDERVLVYKREHGFDVLSPRIAVVVEQQIDSEVAGVGFSLNPLTNDYDEAVIDANFGLGESVVAGLVSPDHFVVDKASRQIVNKKLGAKEISIWLSPDGGALQQKGHRSSEFTLSDAQLGELTELICRIEELYGQPVDIEWAYAGGQLHLLQARPITAYVPLPPEMLTRPGERRRLYADAALSKGMTTNAPFSPMELDWGRDFYSFMEEFSGIGQTPDEGLVFFAGGRMYMNLSNMLWATSPEKLAKGTSATDVLMAGTLANVDTKRYRAATRPPWMRLRSLRFVPKVLWLLRGGLWGMLWAMLCPERAHRTYQQKAHAYEAELTGNLDESLSLTEFRQTYAPAMTRQLFGVTAPVLGAAMAALGSVDLVVGKKSDEEKALAQRLKFGFTGDVVIEMGIALFRLAKLVDPSDFKDLTRLAERVEGRQMSPEFMNAWDDFLSIYGWRGALEMDLASPRYADDPGLALRQMSFMSLDDEGFDPEAVHQSRVADRRRAYEELMSRLSWPRRTLLRRIYRIIDQLAGARDAPKHQVVLFKYALRKRVLAEGRRLAREGRLDQAEDVFNLRFHDLESANSNSSLDLRKVIEEQTRFLQMLRAHVSEFPKVIDSRGRILRPAPRQERPGELSGMPVSPGVVTGPVKLLRDPHEKPVSKGDVLVAYTTDPGWTPLFVNAAAIVLEVGGVLQHGAVVAREYGKPCVAGIDHLMTRLHDGQTVEVDGTAGVVRLLQEPGTSQCRSTAIPNLPSGFRRSDPFQR